MRGAHPAGMLRLGASRTPLREFVSPPAGFEGFHAGLCRTLLTQMSEFADHRESWTPVSWALRRQGRLQIRMLARTCRRPESPRLRCLLVLGESLAGCAAWAQGCRAMEPPAPVPKAKPIFALIRCRVSPLLARF